MFTSAEERFSTANICPRMARMNANKLRENELVRWSIILEPIAQGLSAWGELVQAGLVEDHGQVESSAAHRLVAGCWGLVAAEAESLVYNLVAANWKKVGSVGSWQTPKWLEKCFILCRRGSERAPCCPIGT